MAASRLALVAEPTPGIERRTSARRRRLALAPSSRSMRLSEASSSTQRRRNSTRSWKSAKALVQRRGGFQAFHAPEAGEDLGVHVGGLDQQAEGLGEVSCAVRAHGHGLPAGRRQALVQRAAVASGGLEHSALYAVLAQPVAQSAPAELVVGEAADVPPGSICESSQRLRTSMPATMA